MAGPGELMLAVSEATGVPLPTVTDMDRRLAKAGLRSKNGRGRNAARMTALDAARLLTAILASPQATTCVDAAARYAATRIDKARSTEGAFAPLGLPDLAALRAQHGFVDALAALIASASSGGMTTAADDIPRIEIFAFTRATRGRIRLAGLPGGRTVSLEYVPIRAARADARAIDPGDLEQSRRITGRTILAVADLLKGGTIDDR